MQCIIILNNRRPLLQRQQRQSSEETEVSSLRGSVHFKEDPEYFDNAAASKAIVATTNSINALTSSAQSDLCLGEEKIYEQIRGKLNLSLCIPYAQCGNFRILREINFWES